MQFGFRGGEPLLRRDIVDICKKISSKNIKPSISTNGILLTDSLIKELNDSGVDYIHLSIDGSTAKTHEALRGVKGSFGLLMNAMDRLKKSNIKAGASFMVTEDSVYEMDDVIDIAIDKDLSVISFYLVAELGRGTNFKSNNDLITKLQDNIEKINNKLNNINSKLKVEVFRADRLRSNENMGLQECKAGNFLNITYDGYLGACPWLMKSEDGFVAGSLLEADFVVLKEKCQNIIRQKKEKRREKMKFCKECAQNDMCGKGCLALQIRDNSLYYNALDPICPALNKMNNSSYEVETVC